MSDQSQGKQFCSPKSLDVPRTRIDLPEDTVD